MLASSEVSKDDEEEVSTPALRSLKEGDRRTKPEPVMPVAGAEDAAVEATIQEDITTA